MKIQSILQRNPLEQGLANNGQARITQATDDRAVRELRAELETFVCDGEYGKAIERILGGYLAQLEQPRQVSAWVSGFYGSGKSHLLKMLGHLWVDTEFPDGTSARNLVHGLSDEAQALLKELDGKATRLGKPQVAAVGTLPAGSGDHVRKTVLSVVLQSQGLPTTYAQASFYFWLREQGYLDTVRQAVEDAGKDFLKEFGRMYVSRPIADALMELDPGLAKEKKDVREVLRAQFPDTTTDIGTSEFIEAMQQALAPEGEIPHTILVLDEIQQYIGDSTDRAVLITEVAEAVQTQLDSRVLMVGSGQSALSSTPLLQRLRDRFRIPVQLSETDVEAVTRKVLLKKKAKAVEPVRELLENNAGEVDKQLQGTKIAARPEDRDIIVEDYPLLPVRRRFWENCFRVVDAGGTQSQLRSQLQILHEALKRIADEDLGTVIPGDLLYTFISPNMVNTGVLLNEIDTRIKSLDDGTEEGRLKSRICGLVFLINKLPRDEAADQGVRATAAHIADLMIAELDGDSGPFRKSAEEALESLAENGVLMVVEDEYRIQTTEGAEWDRAFRERCAALRQQEAEIAARRHDSLAGIVQASVAGLRPKHGEARLPRSARLHAEEAEPSLEGDQLVIWLRDGWNASQSEVENEARRRGHSDPVIHVFLPRKAHDDLKNRIIEAEAARQVLDTKGVPSAPEGKEAMESMRSRRASAEDGRDRLAREIVLAAHVYLGGGTEVFGDSLEGKLEQAVDNALARLFPRFQEADSRAWELALKRAREGSDEPFRAVGWDRQLTDHPVCREVQNAIGRGAKGSEVRKHLQSAPFGWPRDAIDAALIALHRAGVLTAMLEARPLRAGELDQNKIPKTDFRPETTPLGMSEKIAIRGLIAQAGLSAKTGEEVPASHQFLTHLQDLARRAGGEPPLPEPPDTTHIQKLLDLAGNERLSAMLEARKQLEENLESWPEIANQVEKRLPAWERLERLLERCHGLEGVEAVAEEISAIRDSRALLEGDDPVPALESKLGSGLRSRLTQLHTELQEAHDRAIQTLEADDRWNELSTNDQQAILKQVALAEPQPPALKTTDDLLRELSHRSLDARADAISAVPDRVTRALEAAARANTPEARRVSLKPATLSSEKEVKEWLAEQEENLLDAVRHGPVIIG